MKRIFTRLASFAALSALAFGLAGCVEPNIEEEGNEDEPEVKESTFEVSFKSATQTTAEISINAEGITEIAYVLSTEEADYSDHAVLFKVGKTVDPASGTLKLEELDANKTYWAYFAAKIDNAEYFEHIRVLEFKTADYEFTELVTLVDTDYMGYSVRIKVPESVSKEPEKYGIRYNFGSICDVMDAKFGMSRTWAANLLENGHGCMGWQETQRDTTIIISPYNENRLNPDGSEYVDPDTGGPIQLHLPIAPGEPYVFIAGEYRYGNIDENGWGWTYGTPEKDMGYYIPLWDEEAWVTANGGTDPKKEHFVVDEAKGLVTTNEEQFWTGAIQARFFRTKLPGELETNLEIYVDDKDLIDEPVNDRYTVSNSPVDAAIKIIPDDNVYCYSYFICNDAFYKQLVDEVLLGHEDWLQWFICSYYGMRSLSIPTVTGPLNNEMASYVIGAHLDPENVYHILVTATSDQNGTKQKFFHKKFETPAKVLEAPVIKVTAVEDGKNEYFAKFNIKAPNKDVISAKYGADYKREFILDFNSGDYKYEDFAQNPLSEADIQKINSDEGLEIWINSTDGQTTRCVVVGYNEELTKNAVFSPEKVGPCDAVADCSTKMLDMVPKVNSPLFDQLEGVWTAHAKMLVRAYDSNNVLQIYQTDAKQKVEIMKNIELPQLTSSDYAVYESFGMSKQDVDALYMDLQREVDHFNDYRLTYRNRLLCLGWFDYDPYGDPSRLSTKSPYDLFTWDMYSCIDNAQIMYEFGPKWYMEIDKEGNVTVPFDMWQTPPMTSWQTTPFFMSAYAYYGNDGKELNHGYKTGVTKKTTGEEFMPAAFPVEVSSNKVVIKPVMAAVDTTAANLSSAKLHAHYPNAIGGWGEADAQLLRPVISEITLTKGWTESSTNAPARFARENYVERVEMSGGDAKPVVFKSMTARPEVRKHKPFKHVRPIFYKTDEDYYRDFPEHRNR